MGNKHSQANTLELSASTSFTHSKFPKALFQLEKSLSLRLQIYHLSPLDPELQISLTNTLNNIGHIHTFQANYPQALKIFDQSANILSRSSYNYSHRNLATAYNGIARVYIDQARYKKALEALAHAKKILSRLIEDHPLDRLVNCELANTLNYTSELELLAGNPEKSVKTGLQALEIQRKKVGEVNINTAKIYNNYARALFSTSEFAQCKEALDRAVMIIRELDQKGLNPELARIFDTMAMYFLKKGELFDAQEVVTKGINIRLRTLQRKKHPEMARSYLILGRVKLEKDCRTEAMRYFGKAYKIAARNFCPEHPLVVEIYEELTRLESEVRVNCRGLFEAYKLVEAAAEEYSRPKVRSLFFGYRDMNFLRYQPSGVDLLVDENDGFEKFRQIARKNNRDFANSYYTISFFFFNINHFREAVVYLQKAVPFDYKTGKEGTLGCVMETRGNLMKKIWDFKETNESWTIAYLLSLKRYSRNHKVSNDFKAKLGYLRSWMDEFDLEKVEI